MKRLTIGEEASARPRSTSSPHVPDLVFPPEPRTIRNHTRPSPPSHPAPPGRRGTGGPPYLAIPRLSCSCTFRTATPPPRLCLCASEALLPFSVSPSPLRAGPAIARPGPAVEAVGPGPHPNAAPSLKWRASRSSGAWLRSRVSAPTEAPGSSARPRGGISALTAAAPTESRALRAPPSLSSRARPAGGAATVNRSACTSINSLLTIEVLALL